MENRKWLMYGKWVMEKGKWRLAIIVHNVRSAHNVGSILRSADGFGINKIYFSGYTPYPKSDSDERLPHLAARIDRQIHKTALGAEKSVQWKHIENIERLVDKLKSEEFLIAALEQTKRAKKLDEFKPVHSIALIVGNEIEGLDQKTLESCDVHLQIPMRGAKESFNVAVATAIAMYHFAESQTGQKKA